MKTPRWSQPLVDQLVARRDELATQIPDDVDQDELLEALGLDYAAWRRGRGAGLIPDPDRDPYWTRPVAEELTARAAEIRAAIPPQPLGVRRCAELLAELTGLQVDDADVGVLIKRGLTTEVDWYKNWPLYDVGALQQLVATDDGRKILAEIVADRQTWMTESIERREAARFLGWAEEDLTRVAAARGIKLGRFYRFACADINALAADEDLMGEVRRQQLLGPEQAAQHMEIRRRDFDYVAAAGWVRPAQYVTREVGMRKTVQVPLFRVGDLEDAIADVPGVDWEAVRAVKPGEVSPLREHTRLPARRAEVIRAFCAQLGADYGIEVWPHWWNAGDRWEIDWELREDEQPTKAAVAAALAAHKGASQYASQITLSTEVGQVIRWARECLRPGAAVICDTETTDLDGVVIEIAVVDACTGEVLLDTLVHPDGVPISPGAGAVHGITDAELSGAPPWAEVAPAFTEAVGGRRILAYNAAFDAARIIETHQHAGLRPTQLPPQDRWDCLMEARSTWRRVGYWLPLGGGHRARGDALDARTVLQAIGAPPAQRPGGTG